MRGEYILSFRKLTRVDADPHHGEANHGMQHFEPMEKVPHHQQSKS